MSQTARTGVSPEPLADDLLVMERRFDRALLSSDVQALQAILSERIFLNDFLGGVIARSELLKYPGAGELNFTESRHTMFPSSATATQAAQAWSPAGRK